MGKPLLSLLAVIMTVRQSPVIIVIRLAKLTSDLAVKEWLHCVTCLSQINFRWFDFDGFHLPGGPLTCQELHQPVTVTLFVLL